MISATRDCEEVSCLLISTIEDQPEDQDNRRKFQEFPDTRLASDQVWSGDWNQEMLNFEEISWQGQGGLPCGQRALK